MSHDFSNLIARVDERLDDQTLSADQRVNWLIARAQAEEIHFGRGNRHAWNYPDLALGRPWIDEALLCASEANQGRVKQELISRLVAMGNFYEAARETDSLARATKDAAGVAIVEKWDAAMEKFGKAEEQWQEQNLKASQDFYRAQLAAIRDRAVARGDSDTAEQYEKYLNELPAEPK